MDSTDDRPTGIHHARDLFAHLVPTRGLTVDEQAAITQREHARRRGRGRKNWQRRVASPTPGPKDAP